jgi:hypothetical protein
MTRALLAFMTAISLVCLPAAAKAPARSAPRPLELDVWRGAPPGAESVTVEQTVVERSTQPGLHDGALIGIRRPTLTIYKPNKPDGSAVLILPGGAYLRVVIRQGR